MGRTARDAFKPNRTGCKGLLTIIDEGLLTCEEIVRKSVYILSFAEEQDAKTDAQR